MKAYLDLMAEVLDRGERRSDRTGVGTRSLFGRQLRFSLEQGFPIVTTKKVHFKSVAMELLWFLRGETNVQWLQDHGVRIWNEWADDDGNLGPVYGAQWRSWRGANGKTYDQIKDVIARIVLDPMSRRLIVNAWNVGEIDNMALPPCHTMFQFYVSNDRKLSCQLYQRSADIFLGVPFNIASYALLTHMIAQVTGLGVGDFVHTFGDVHLYENHLDVAKVQLAREPKPLPELQLDPSVKAIDDFQYDHMKLVGYQHDPAIPAPIAV